MYLLEYEVRRLKTADKRFNDKYLQPLLRTENPCVGGSNPPLPIFDKLSLWLEIPVFWLFTVIFYSSIFPTNNLVFLPQCVQASG